MNLNQHLPHISEFRDFRCPECGGSWFGTSGWGEDASMEGATIRCHSEFGYCEYEAPYNKPEHWTGPIGELLWYGGVPPTTGQYALCVLTDGSLYLTTDGSSPLPIMLHAYVEAPVSFNIDI